MQSEKYADEEMWLVMEMVVGVREVSEFEFD